MKDLYITTSIPYVNGSPHLGHALEFVHVDTLARHRRLRGAAVRSQSGTDDHALKNVTAARSSGVPVTEVVACNGDRFLSLATALGFHPDEFLRTSSDPRHGSWVRRLWRACSDDLYTKDYCGLYCPGCEQFYAPDELADGRCSEHKTPVEEVTETNWFFRLSRYRDQLLDLLSSGVVEVTPVERRNEVLGFLSGEVHDLSVSRPASRANGWGIAVPGDDSQVIYVWFDALANYLSGLDSFEKWWAGDAEKVHVIGKGIVRFHAVHWLAFLLSAGLPLPSRVLVHDYLTVDGAKIAKSGAHSAAPVDVIDRYGVDALRWWFLRDPALVGTTDFTVERLVAAYNQDLANAIGNLVSRTVSVARRRFNVAPAAGVGGALLRAAAALPDVIDEALSRYDLRAACEAIVALAEEGNRLISAEEPWHLAKAGTPDAAARFEAVAGAVLEACHVLATELAPFVPGGASRLADQLSGACGVAFPRIRG
jgi:methionyl-tRNA synthetase